MADLAIEAKALLAELGARARRSFGQNFMISEPTLAAIADAAGLEAGQTVVEIGPGLGFLTRELLGRGARVVAIEKDRLFAAHLKKSFASDRFRVLEADVLEVRPKKDLGLGGPAPVVGNIPYNITSPILEWLIENRGFFPRAVLTVQKEVAQRLTARPDTEHWGALSVYAQLYAEVETVREVPRSCFSPAPRVDSAVIRLAFSEGPRTAVKDAARLTQLSQRAFQKRRKTLLNALEKGDKDALRAVLERIGIEARRRPETLTLEEWARLSDALGEVREPVL